MIDHPSLFEKIMIYSLQKLKLFTDVNNQWI